jgi:hypothetical protein
MKTIPVTPDLVAQVDDEEYERACSHRWHKFVSGRNTYAQDSGLLLHTFIMGRSGIDHRDGNGLNCQKYNLRDADASQNAINSRKQEGTSSRYKGVTYDRTACGKDKKWKAYITKKGRRYTKMFATEEEAARWRDSKATELFGDFARLNFPGE